MKIKKIPIKTPRGFEIGQTVRHTYSGFQGQVRHLYHSYTGNWSTSVTPEGLDPVTSKPWSCEYFEEIELEIVTPSPNAPVLFETFDFTIGDFVRDRIYGKDERWEVFALTYYTTGCVVATLRDGKFDNEGNPNYFNLDVGLLQVIEKTSEGSEKPEKAKTSRGGPMPILPRMGLV